jgi:hypothetical protein
MEIFNQAFTIKTANEIWLKLHELHDSTSNAREQKHCLVLNDYNSFAMKDNELVRDMYSRLNLIINELNSIGINKLGDADIVRKIISLLPQQKYGSIITILHNMEDLSTMAPIIKDCGIWNVAKHRSREANFFSPYAFACNEKKKGKKKAPTLSSSSEEEEEEESDDDEDDQPSTSTSEGKEIVWRVGKVMGMIHKINLMGVPLQVEDLLFNIDRKRQRKRECFACRDKGHFRDNYPNMDEPTKRRSKGKTLTSVKTWDDSSSEDDPPRTRSHRSSSRSSRSSHKFLMVRGKTSISSSSDDSDDEGKPSIDELAMSWIFLRMCAVNKRLNLKLWKISWLDFKMIINVC